MSVSPCQLVPDKPHVLEPSPSGWFHHDLDAVVLFVAEGPVHLGRVVQRHALAALDGGPEFRAALESDPDVRRTLPPERLAACFTLDPYFRNVDALYARARYPEP